MGASPKHPHLREDAEARERGGEASTPSVGKAGGDAAPGGRCLKGTLLLRREARGTPTRQAIPFNHS